MNSPLVSVIIPAYNQADYLGEAIQSILDQSYNNYEIIIVDDASPDHTKVVVNKFVDPRIKYIVHKENRYAAAARNTGIKAATGDLISFLDADDKIHRDKLKEQITFLKKHPDVGLAYCSRIEIDESGEPLTIFPAQPKVNLRDLVLGFPFTPSDVVVQKEWVFRAGLFDESYTFSAEDPDLFMRLALLGCAMEGVDRVLNYRRRHYGRVVNNLPDAIEDQLRAFEITFSNPICPSDVISLRDKCMGWHYMIFSYIAFSQDDSILGQELLREAIRFDHTLFNEESGHYVKFLIMNSIRDGGDHEALIKKVIPQLPSELGWVTQHAETAIGFGYLLRWVRDFTWGRIEQGKRNFEHAIKLGFKPDDEFLHQAIHQLLNYKNEYGSEAALKILNDLYPYLEKYSGVHYARQFKAEYSLKQAFRDYSIEEYSKVLPNTLRAIASNPNNLRNRGVLSILFHSSIGLLTGHP